MKLIFQWGGPVAREYETWEKYQFAVRRANLGSHLMLLMLEPSGLSPGGHWDIAAWRAELVPGRAVTNCVICGQPIRSKALNALGYSLHQRCLLNPIPDTSVQGVMETFDMLGEPVKYIRSWKEVLAFPGKR